MTIQNTTKWLYLSQSEQKEKSVDTLLSVPTFFLIYDYLGQDMTIFKISPTLSMGVIGESLNRPCWDSITVQTVQM